MSIPKESDKRTPAYWGELDTDDKKSGGPEDVAFSNNHLWYYAAVNKSSVLKLNKQLKIISAKNTTLQHELELDTPIPVKLYINSGGGLITAGISGMDAIFRNSVPVHTVVDGFCASAATFMSVAGWKRYMTKHSLMLIHQLSTNFWGKYKEFEDEKKNLDLMMDMIKSIYNKYTKVPSEELDGILDHDLMWDADKCMKWGLVDEIV